jgi:hypothetical protein
MKAMLIDTRNGGDSNLAERYEADGFVFPIEAVSRDDAGRVRSDLEAAEAELAEDPARLGLLRAYPDRLLPSFDALI